jgi:hypothetical protein
MLRLCLAALFVAGCGNAPETDAGGIAPNASTSALADVESGCLRYELETVSITGTLERRTYPGAPGYGEDPDDELETGFYLVPAESLCTVPGADPANEPRRDIRLVQLVLDSAGYATGRPLLGTRVRATGTLMGAQTGHHHAPLLLRGASLSPLP